MSRVWKRFLLTIAKYIGIGVLVVAWFILCAFAITLLGISDSNAGGLVFTFIFLGIPGAIFGCRMLFLSIKEEVEKENQDMLDKIRKGY